MPGCSKAVLHQQAAAIKRMFETYVSMHKIVNTF